jgi:hypothetical protein
VGETHTSVVIYTNLDALVLLVLVWLVLVQSHLLDEMISSPSPLGWRPRNQGLIAALACMARGLTSGVATTTRGGPSIEGIVLE